MSRTIPHDDREIDMRGFGAIAVGPAVAAVLMAALAQSLGYWHGTDPVLAAGGPVRLLLGTSMLLYALFALVHFLHWIGDRLTGRPTPLWWLPERMAEDEETVPGIGAAGAPAVAAFPDHLDGAALSLALALVSWLALQGVI
jgi:hypothetical protein